MSREISSRKRSLTLRALESVLFSTLRRSRAHAQQLGQCFDSTEGAICTGAFRHTSLCNMIMHARSFTSVATRSCHCYSRAPLTCIRIFSRVCHRRSFLVCAPSLTQWLELQPSSGYRSSKYRHRAAMMKAHKKSVWERTFQADQMPIGSRRMPLPASVPLCCAPVGAWRSCEDNFKTSLSCCSVREHASRG